MVIALGWLRHSQQWQGHWAERRGPHCHTTPVFHLQSQRNHLTCLGTLWDLGKAEQRQQNLIILAVWQIDDPAAEYCHLTRQMEEERIVEEKEWDHQQHFFKFLSNTLPDVEHWLPLMLYRELEDIMRPHAPAPFPLQQGTRVCHPRCLGGGGGITSKVSYWNCGLLCLCLAFHWMLVLSGMYLYEVEQQEQSFATVLVPLPLACSP